MKKTLLIISILSIIFLTGCGLFNVNGWICPEDDQEFMELVNSLNTPEKICKYMESFKWNISLHTYSPYQMYLANLKDYNDTGDCDDFATFATWVARYHGYEVYRIYLWGKFTGFYGLPLILPHVMGVFVEDGKYTYSNCYLYNPLYADNFKSIIQDYELTQYPVIFYKVYDYENNLIEKGYM